MPREFGRNRRVAQLIKEELAIFDTRKISFKSVWTNNSSQC